MSHLVATPHPFSSIRIDKFVAAGKTVTAILEEAAMDEALSKAQQSTRLQLIEQGQVWVEIAGAPVPSEWWDYIKVKDGVLITAVFQPYRGGGGDGGKDPLRTVLTIAVIIAAAYVGPMVSAYAVSSGYAVAGSITAKVIGAAASGLVTALGSIAINAIVPPPSPALSDLSQSGSSAKTSPTLSISGARNRANHYGPVPRVMGRHKMFPLYAAPPYTMNVGDDQYLYMLFDFGYGPLQLSDHRIGTNPLANFEEVETHFIQSSTAGQQLNLYRDTVRTDSYSLAVEQAGAAKVIVSRPEADELILETEFNGLVTFDDAGNRNTRTVEFTVEYRRANTSDAYETVSSPSSELLPSTGVTATSKPIGESYIEYRTDNEAFGPITITFPRTASFQGVSLWRIYYDVYTRVYGSSAWVIQHQNVESSILNTAPATVSVMPQNGAVMEIKIVRSRYGVNGAGSLTGNSASFDAFPAPSFSYKYGSGSSFLAIGSTPELVRKPVVIPIQSAWRGKAIEVRVTRLTADSTDNQVLDSMFISQLKTIKMASPVNVVGHTLMELKIRASDQLNGPVDTYSAVAEALLDVWNGSTWTSALTRNPAWAYCELFRGSMNNNPIADARLDLAAILEWANACDAAAPQVPAFVPDNVTWYGDEPYWTFDAVFDYRATIFEFARIVAAAGRASLHMNEDKFSVVRDTLKTTPVQQFNPRNSRGFQGTRTYPDLPHGFKVKFVDPDSDWKQGEVTVYRDGYTVANASKFEVLEQYGCTRSSQAWREGRFHIGQAELRLDQYEIITSLDHLVCTRGSLVAVSHDVPQWGLGHARIKSVVADGGGNITSIELDDFMTMEAGKSYAIRVRMAVGTSVYSTVDLFVGDTYVVTPTTAIPVATAPAIGDLVSFGEAGLETVELLVHSIEPFGDLEAKVRLVDHAPGIYTADQGAIPDYSPQRTDDPTTTPPAAAEDLVAVASSDRLTRGLIQSTIDVTWKQPSGQLAVAWEVYHSQEAEGVATITKLLDIVSVPRFSTTTLPTQFTHTFTIVGIGASGAKLSIVNSPSVAVYNSGRLTAPGLPQNVRLTFSQGQALLTWNLAEDAFTYEASIQTPVTATPAHGGTLTPTQTISDIMDNNVSFPAVLAGTYYVYLRSVNSQGTKSAAVVRTITLSKAWADNVILTPVNFDFTTGAFSNGLCLTPSDTIHRLAAYGTNWFIPTSADDCSNQLTVSALASVPAHELSLVDPSWLVGPKLIGESTWVSAIIDLATPLDGVWYTDHHAEVLDRSSPTYLSKVNPATVSGLLPDLLLPGDDTITISVEVGSQADLSDGTPIIAAFEGTARYARATVLSRSSSGVMEAFVDSIALHCDAPERFDRGRSTLTLTTETITFSTSFRTGTVPNVVLTPEGSAAIVLNSVTSTGFSVTGLVSDVFHWTAQGV